jgi:transposase InsO family protein
MIAFIEENRDIGVEPICKHLPIAPSTFYDHMAKRANPDLLSDRAKRDIALKPEIERVWEQNYKVYGVRKVWHQMRREGFDIASCTVARLMKDIGIEGIIRGKKARTTIPDKSQPCPLDRVNRQFKTPAPDMLWVSDFTYVATWQGFVYVAFVIDAFARRIVGWRVSRTANAGFVLDALEQAVHQRRPSSGLVHHSDRGSQYLSIKYTERLAEAGIEPSVAAIVTRTDGVPWRPSGTATTMLWPRRSTVFSKQRSFIAVGHGAASTPWNMPHSNGSIGSTTAACWNPSGISRQQRPKQITTPLWKLRPWRRN